MPADGGVGSVRETEFAQPRGTRLVRRVRHVGEWEETVEHDPLERRAIE